MLVAQALRDFTEEERRTLIGEVDAECVVRFPVIHYLRLCGVHLGLATTTPTELVRFTIRRMIDLDLSATRDEVGEPCSILPSDIAPEDVEGVAIHVATYAKAMLRESLPEKLRELDLIGQLSKVKAKAVADATAFYEESFRPDAPSSTYGDGYLATSDSTGDVAAFHRGNIILDDGMVGLWCLTGALQATRFSTDRDVHLWDFAASIFALYERARSSTGESWSLQGIAAHMNLDPGIPAPGAHEVWTAELVEKVQSRFTSFQQHIRRAAEAVTTA